jgi:hypothetical protein
LLSHRFFAPQGLRGEASAAVWLTSAATLLALSLQIRSGHLDPFAIVLLAGTLAALVLAVRGRVWPAVEAAGLPAVERALGVGLAASLIGHLPRPPGIHLDITGFLARIPFLIGLLAVAVLVAGALFRPQQGAAARTPLLLALFLVMGAWVIRHSPQPHIDVFVLQRDAVAGLLDGQNPYTMSFPNIYGRSSPYYAPGMVVGDRLNIGFHYPPLPLLLAVPGAVLGGDVRYAHLVALALAGAVLAYLRPGRVGFLAAALLLFSPRTFFVIEQSWTDTFVLALLCLVAFCAVRWPRGLPVALGLLFACKQYLVLAVPLLWFLPPQAFPRVGRAATFAIAVAVAAGCTLPFALWDFSAFWASLVSVQFQLPFRADALSFPAAFAYLTGVRLPAALGFAAAAAALVVAFRRFARTGAGFAAAFAVVYFVFFAFNRQAFCNYYFVVLGALCLALAAWAPDPAPAPA